MERHKTGLWWLFTFDIIGIIGSYFGLFGVSNPKKVWKNEERSVFNCQFLEIMLWLGNWRYDFDTNGNRITHLRESEVYMAVLRGVLTFQTIEIGAWQGWNITQPWWIHVLTSDFLGVGDLGWVDLEIGESVFGLNTMTDIFYVPNVTSEGVKFIRLNDSLDPNRFQQSYSRFEKAATSVFHHGFAVPITTPVSWVEAV